MAGSSIGTLFRITTWGESHGSAIGVVIDGCPAGLPLSEDDIQPYLDRRAPGRSQFATARKEPDQAQILSGVFSGMTTGCPISILVHNTDQRSRDYTSLMDVYRPGHADYSFDQKYGFRDYRGGGRSSGRETIGRVAAGAVAAKLLSHFGISIHAYIKSIGPIDCENGALSPDVFAYIDECVKQKDSAGGIIECIATGMLPGLGDPVFDKLDANLAKAIVSIGAVKGIEFGDGFAAALHKASENNDSFRNFEGTIKKETNHSGGVLGGISDGDILLFRAAVKPTPSISQAQQTCRKDGSETSVVIEGRHDPVIVPRAVVVVECMTALVLADSFLVNASARIDTLEKIYHQ